MKIFQYIYPLSIFPLFAFPLFQEDVTMKFFILFSVLSLVNYFINREKKESFYQYSFHFIPFIIILIASLLHFSFNDNLLELNSAGLFILMPLVFYLSPSYLFTKEKIKQYLLFMCYTSLILIFLYLILFLKDNPLYDLVRSKYNSSFFRDFVYDKSGFFTIHPAYFSIILLFLTAFSIEQLKKAFQLKYLIFIFCF